MLGAFFYHARVFALVHLVTLGWVTCSILGALYLVGPVALRTTFPATWLDGIAFAGVTIGVLGMVSHFWLNVYEGMAWAAGALLVGIMLVGYRVLGPLSRAPVPFAIKLHIGLAFANILGAGLLGALIGLEKQRVLAIPGFVLSHVYAHAHLAALGWATMMVMGIGYRLLPMLIPAAMPRGGLVLATAVLLEIGVVGLLVTLISASSWVWVFALATVGAILLFLAHIVWMLGHKKPPPRALPRPDLALGHTLQSFIYLLLTAAIGLALLVMPESLDKFRLGFVYGVFGLLGYLAQLIVGVGARLLPLVTWMQTFVRSDFKSPPRSQYQMLDRQMQALTLILWTAGVPGLAAALYLQAPRGISLAALALMCASIMDSANRLLVVRELRRGARSISPAEPGNRPKSPPGS